MPTTWNPADKAASVTLSGGDLIASAPGSSGGVRATNSLTGLNYFEIKAVSGAAPVEPAFAIFTTGVSLTTGAGGNGVLIYYNGAQFVVTDTANNPLGAFAGTVANNDVIGIAFDASNLKLYVARNGTWQIGDPAAGTGGITLPSATYFPATFLGAGGGSGVSQLQADTTTYSPPSGYSLIGGGGPAGYTLTADRGTFGLTGQAANFPNLVSKAAYKGAANGTTTATIPAHVAGDILIAFAFRDGSTTQPVLPSGWTAIRQQTGTTCCGRWAWKRAASSSETSGTWTNASALEITVHSGVDRVGASNSQAGTAASVTWPALTMEFGNSWVHASAGHRSVNTSLETPPTGFTVRDGRVDATAEAAVFDTNGLVTSFSAVSRNVGGTASGWVAGSIELVPSWAGAAGAASYTLTADRGAYTYTGIQAGLRSARKLVAAQGTYTLTGQAAGLKRGLKVAANQGSYSLTGQSAGLTATRKLTAAQGSYSLTGIAADLIYSPASAAYMLTADAGSYAVSGQGAGLRRALRLAADQGVYSLTGRAADLLATRKLIASAGGYSVSGQVARLAAARKLVAAQGTYTLTGRSVSFNGQRLLLASAGSYAVAGQPATLTYTPAPGSYVLSAAAGAYALSGQAAGLVYAPIAPPVEPEPPVYGGGAGSGRGGGRSGRSAVYIPVDLGRGKKKRRKDELPVIEPPPAVPAIDPAVVEHVERVIFEQSRTDMARIHRALKYRETALEFAAIAARQADDDDEAILLLLAA